MKLAIEVNWVCTCTHASCGTNKNCCSSYTQASYETAPSSGRGHVIMS